MEPSFCSPHQNSCRTANKYFGNPRQPLTVSKCEATPRDICWFESKGSPEKTELFCSSRVCGSNTTIFVSKRDPKYGDVKQWTAVNPFKTAKVLEFTQKALQERETFCFIKCGSILQVLVFPPHLYLKKTNKSTNKINVNIVVMDSISRAHFYRMLRKSVNALRDLLYNESLGATVLDFELLQSISTHTFENIRPLFSGVVVGNKEFGHLSAKHTELGINVLYDYFQTHGYQTIFQEDLCWYDRWGTMLDNIEMKGGSKPTIKGWSKFKDTISKHKIDHFGITFFSCEVFKLFSDTNHYETPSKVCFNGEFFSSFFLRYLKDFTNDVRTSNGDAKPYISYTHFNTGHTRTGVRILNTDEGLADFISNVGRDPWTWTIFLSDHGHRTTPFAYSTDGIYETFNPPLFMIIPQKVAQILGKERMNALNVNQKRLITTLDIHRALITIYNNDTTQHDSKMSGIFSTVPWNRTCSDVPLMPLTKCQCFGSEQKYEDNSRKHQWMAEFAVGALNNQIQRQFSKGKEGKKTVGFGNCKRLVGSSFRNIVQTGTLTTFDLHLNASYVGLKQDEIFKVALDIQEDKAVLKSFDRQTMYNKFKDCVDASVDIKLCVCDRRQRQGVSNGVLTRTEMIALVKSPTFRSTPTVKNLYKDCLFEVTRRYFDVATVVEVANACKGQSFKVKVTGWTDKVFISTLLPMEVIVKPNTIHFLYSSTKQSLSHSYLQVSLQAQLIT
ncbi:hypothetical protein QZH41_019438 [Actinostola sp. cb2023]|nr:hypothetical protein QZH41_019438 [Actinostola sp. cb2023]